MGVGTIKTYKLGAFAFAIATATSASAAVLDFEGFDPGRIIDSEYAPDVAITAINFSSGPDVAVIFDTTDSNPAGGDFDLVAPFDSADPDLPDQYFPGNVLIIQERDDCDFGSGFCAVPDDEGSRPAGIIEFVFSQDVILDSLDFFDIEFEENNRSPNSQIHLYDALGNEVDRGLWFVPSTGGDNTWTRLDFGGVSGVRRLIIEMGGSGAIDDLSYQVVPAPAAIWLFGSAIALLGWVRRWLQVAPAQPVGQAP